MKGIFVHFHICLFIYFYIYMMHELLWAIRFETRPAAYLVQLILMRYEWCHDDIIQSYNCLIQCVCRFLWWFLSGTWFLSRQQGSVLTVVPTVAVVGGCMRALHTLYLQLTDALFPLSCEVANLRMIVTWINRTIPVNTQNHSECFCVFLLEPEHITPASSSTAERRSITDRPGQW